MATLSVAVGWQLYAHHPLSRLLSGWPVWSNSCLIFILTLPAGELCDRLGPKGSSLPAWLLDALCARSSSG